MRLYIYHGLDNEKVPEDITHAIIEESVTIIKAKDFRACKDLVSVIMDSNVKRIEMKAFQCCISLRFIRLSKTLEYIGGQAFAGCLSLEVLFIPSTVKSIRNLAFCLCKSLRLLILPNDFDLNNVGLHFIISQKAIEQIARAAGVEYGAGENLVNLAWVNAGNDHRVTKWLIRHMDEASFHKLCYNLSINTQKIIDYLNENGINSPLQIDTIHGMTPLHMLSTCSSHFHRCVSQFQYESYLLFR